MRGDCICAAFDKVDPVRVAAPEMLAALTSIVPSLESRLTAKPKDVEAWDILNRAKEAIRKANS